MIHTVCWTHVFSIYTQCEKCGTPWNVDIIIRPYTQIDIQACMLWYSLRDHVHTFPAQVCLPMASWAENWIWVIPVSALTTAELPTRSPFSSSNCIIKKHRYVLTQFQQMSFIQSPSLSNNPKILLKQILFTDTSQLSSHGSTWPTTKPGCCRWFINVPLFSHNFTKCVGFTLHSS